MGASFFLLGPRRWRAFVCGLRHGIWARDPGSAAGAARRPPGSFAAKSHPGSRLEGLRDYDPATDCRKGGHTQTRTRIRKL